MKPGLGRRTKLPAAKRAGERARPHPRTSARHRPTSSAQPGRPRAPRPAWSCPGATSREWRCTWPRSPGTSRRAHHAGQALCAAGRSGGMAHVQAACRAGQRHDRPAAGQMPRIEPYRERLPVHAQQLALEPCVRVLQGHHRSLLQRLEPPCRPTLARNVHRTTQLGRRGSRQVSPGISARHEHRAPFRTRRPAPWRTLAVSTPCMRTLA